jgi:hypothetical protein
MGRLYDKGVEQKAFPPGRWWRWEVEFKAESSVAAAARALSVPEPDRWFDDVACTFFRGRGAIAPAPRSKEVNEPLKPTDDERLLSWLAIGVRPTVSRLIERLGQERVTFSLGLPLPSVVDRPEPADTLN